MSIVIIIKAFARSKFTRAKIVGRYNRLVLQQTLGQSEGTVYGVYMPI